MIALPHEVDRALLDVRRAYRLLHDYQRAALDGVKYIGSQLGFTYNNGYPHFSAPPPKNGKDALKCWAWDWLNLVHFDFNFSKTVEGEGDIYLSIMLFSDTGFYVSADKDAEYTDISSFASVENSETKVGILLYREWLEAWDTSFYEKESIRRFLEHDGELPEEIRLAGVLGKCFKFSQLSDQASADALVAEIIQFGTSNNFPLSRNRKGN